MNVEPTAPSPWKDRLLLSILLVVGSAYSLLSLLRHWRFGSAGYDLGLFDQVVWNVSRFHPPASTIRGFSNILGDHFEPILFAIAPLYWLFDAPETLLLLQPASLCLSAVPVFSFAQRRVGRTAAYLWTAGYLLFWGFQSGVHFDFHPEFLALPMLTFAVDLHDRGRWKPAFACLLLLLAVKENMGLLVAAFGVHLMMLGEWRRAVWALGAGLAGFWLSFGVLVPYFARSQSSQYWGRYSELGSGPAEVFGALFLRPWVAIQLLFSDIQKVLTLFLSFLSSAFLAFFSPLWVLVVPILAERMLGNYRALWGTEYHYSVMMGPILFMAGVDGFYRIGRRLFPNSLPDRAVMIVSGLVLAINLVSVMKFPLKELFEPRSYHRGPVVVSGHEAVAMIPQGASVLAQDFAVPHLSHRREIYGYGKRDLLQECDYVVACERRTPWPFKDFEPIRMDLDRREAQGGYQRVFQKDGWIVLRRSEGLGR